MSEDATLDEFVEDDEHETGWSTVQLGDESYFTRYSGDTPTKNNSDYWGGEIPWLSNSEVQDGKVNLISETEESITENGLKNCTAKIVPERSVILSCTASIGKVGINVERMATNQQFNSFKIERGFNSYYLASKFLSMKEELETLGGSTTHNHLSVYLLDKVGVEKPPLPEQRKIATVLYTLDQIIERTEQTIEQMDIVQQGLLRSLFGKETQRQNPDMETKTERLGPKQFQVPVTWETTEISSIGEVVTGDTPSTDDENNFGGTLPFVTPETLSQGKYVTESSRTLSEAGRSEVKPIPKGSVMMGCIGNIGKLAIANREVATNQQINSVVIDESEYASEFLYYHLRVLSDFIKSQAGQTTIPIVNKSSFKSFNIFKPPIEEQKKIVDTLSIYDEGKQSNRECLTELKRLKQGLMQDLLSGKVRTTDTTIEVPDEIAQHG